MTTSENKQLNLEKTVQDKEDLGKFHHYFSGWMAMYAPIPVVQQYLDTHQEWFRRCARPMKVEALGDMGYTLGVGRYGAFGFYVDPKIGLELVPQNYGVYRIETVPIPGPAPTLYSVDFKALLSLLEIPQTDESGEITIDGVPNVACHLTWELDLGVWLNLPGFIQKLPTNLIRTTGDRILVQVLRQVSQRLTRTVQEDFHRALEIPFPPQLPKGQKLSGLRVLSDYCAEVISNE
ncbi:Protein of unknown function (DUF1997) [Xenococcus sp. PCC 7305]|uniref:DUF1997 domain-containing protein n=1 Tax=Xenococcus sp. PCC 7305 TaxID=102125 RepID=UPI0002AC5F89|nr:DUF1997 domain-containing protein [Xenococcus sp. PCC 7305]ELS04194.1 Protein of unknown function (DUF1997) [Xenococcus sp. PCC 7305]